MSSSFTWPAGSVSPRSSPNAESVQGTYPTQLFRISEVLEEAYSRIGLECRESWHIVDGLRSLRLLFQEWSNRGINLWAIVHEETPVQAGEFRVSTPTDTIDVINVFIRLDQGFDTQMDYYLRRVSTDEYDRIPQKNQTERPTQYWMDRAPRFPEIVLWPMPDMPYVLYYSRLRSLRSPTAGLTGSLDAPDRMIPAMVAGLAYLLAGKNKDAVPLIPALKMEYDRQFAFAGMEDREKSDLMLVPEDAWPL